jgi:membrane associated rhomboid family serine protease
MSPTQEYNRILLVFVLSSIILSTLAWTQVPELKDFYANSHGGLSTYSPIEMLLSPFLHLNGLHLLSNLILLVFVWYSFTSKIPSKFLLPFFLIGEIAQYSTILILNEPPTAGMSGFIFGIFGYMLVVYIKERNPEYKGILLFTFISFLLTSFQDTSTESQTSLVGHLSGYVFWILWSIGVIGLNMLSKKR